VLRTFGRSGFGVLRADLGGNIAATSRTFTSAAEGTYGQFIPLMSAPSTTEPQELLHIEKSSGFRTNLGAINSGSSDQVVRFTLYDSAGRAIGSTDRTLAPLRVVQFSLEVLTSAPILDGRVEVQVIAGDGTPAAWASVIDNITGDPIFVPAQ
jgi:hypothetical protein